MATFQSRVKDAEALTDFNEIKSTFDAFCEEEERVKNELNLLLEQQMMLENKMVSLHKMLPSLQILQSDSKQLTNMISFTSTLAENVSSKVRQLDLAKGNVTSSITRVEDVLDLKFCTDGVQAALQNEEYETAAGHVHRFRSLDENVIRMTADASEGSTLDSSFQLLHEAEEKLKVIVNNRFDAAVHSGDVASVERFFKIFPLLGINEEGLTKFGKYLSSKLSEKSDANLLLALHTDADEKRANVVFADTLTLLFEEIARVVEIHQPLVETYYGPGKLFILLKILQKECDRQARRILDNFKLARKFKFLTEKVQQSTVFAKQISVERLEPKELDVFLSELVILNARTEMYQRFFRRRAMNDIETLTDEKFKADYSKEVEKLLNDCDLRREMQELIGHFISMEEYFMREMVAKAVCMENAEEGSLTSSMVDDVFYIVKKSIRRCISSGSVDGICAMLNHACAILEHDFQEVLYSKLRTGFPSGFDFTQAYNLVQSSIQSGKLQSSDTEKAKSSFLITLNNAEISCDFLKTLKSSIEDDVVKIGNQISEQSKVKIETCLNNLGTVTSRFKEVLDFGFSQLNDSAVKPRIKPMAEAFVSTNHNLSEEDFTIFEANDPWVQNFIVTLDEMLKTFKQSLIPANYDRFVGLISSEITTQLEKAVRKTKFNRLGGLQFDKELRSLVGYLTSVTTWTIRDKFARLSQMATIVNLEKVDEILDYWGSNSGPLTWRLTPTEVRQVLSYRIDFKTDEIKRLKL